MRQKFCSDRIWLAKNAREFTRCSCTLLRNRTWICGKFYIKISFSRVDQHCSKDSVTVYSWNWRKICQKIWKLGYVHNTALIISIIMKNNLNHFPFVRSTDRRTTRAFILNMDGRFDFSLFRHIQKDVGFEARIRRRRSSCHTSQNILSNHWCTLIFIVQPLLFIQLAQPKRAQFRLFVLSWFGSGNDDRHQ